MMKGFGRFDPPIDPCANERTRRILAFFEEIYGEKILSGQYTNHGADTETELLFRETGRYPAVRGFDFINDSPALSSRTGRDAELAVKWSGEGGLVTFSWHWFAPCGRPAFYAEHTDFDLSKAVTTLDVASLPPEELDALWRDGRITTECRLLLRDIDAISVRLRWLEEQNVTVLWRPLHEAAGGWFWWGSWGRDAYLWLWKLMVRRQNGYHGLHNLLWVWNGQAADWYVGDDQCDILGDDVYVSPRDYGAQTDRFAALSRCSSRKMAALTECAVIPDPDELRREAAGWLWFNVWCREFVTDEQGRYSEAYTERAVLQKAYHSSLVLTRGDLPAF